MTLCGRGIYAISSVLCSGNECTLTIKIKINYRVSFVRMITSFKLGFYLGFVPGKKYRAESGENIDFFPFQCGPGVRLADHHRSNTSPFTKQPNYTYSIDEM